MNKNNKIVKSTRSLKDMDYWQELSDFDKGWLFEFSQVFYSNREFPNPRYITKDQQEIIKEGASLRANSFRRSPRFTTNITCVVSSLADLADPFAEFEFAVRKGRHSRNFIPYEEI